MHELATETMGERKQFQRRVVSSKNVRKEKYFSIVFFWAKGYFMHPHLKIISTSRISSIEGVIYACVVMFDWRQPACTNSDVVVVLAYGTKIL